MAELLLIRGHGIKSGIERSKYLHAIHGIHISILTHAFPVYYGIGIILVKIVFKLTPRHLFAPHSHHYRIIWLSHQSEAHAQCQA